MDGGAAEVLKGCTRCGEVKPPSAFHVDRQKKDGRHSICRACAVKSARVRRANPEKRAACIERSRLYKLNNPEKYRSSVRNATLKAKYGIGLVEFAELLAKQGGACALCGATDPGVSWGRNLHVDHDHATGRIRGLLCQPCNTSLGKFKEDPALLRKAANYIEQGGCHQTLDD